MLMTLNPLLHPHYQTGEALRSKWEFLRLRLALCSRNFSKSNQGEHGILPDSTQE